MTDITAMANGLSEAQRRAITREVKHSHGQLFLRVGTLRTMEALERKGLTECETALTPLGLAVRAHILGQERG
ncbi:MAG: hypothetical protein ABW043_16820 [Devosia sp.]|uniref:hypothetical protein n=1 Tax=Devosia sp. TaxID=1871048 RepID=UPI00339991CB